MLILKFTLVLFLTLFATISEAQHVISIGVRDTKGIPISAASVSTVDEEGLNSYYIHCETDSNGTCDLKLSTGRYVIIVTRSGYKKMMDTVDIPIPWIDNSKPSTVYFTLEVGDDEDGHHHEEEEVIVHATRTSRTIANSPTRVEVISGEELEEKGNMKPGDIRMLLNESTGIQVQQTSATSYNSSIRIQGLEGRYTQILKDGFPLYGGFSGGLSLLQIVPLDLKQVEVIKGSASTLYGGGAIAGLVNLVSRTPGDEMVLNFLANGTSAGGIDLSGFYSERYGKIGTTLFVSRNTSNAYDPGETGFSAIPQFERYLVSPKLFYGSEKFEFDLGISYSTEDRLGGSMSYIKNPDNTFFEKNESKRYGVQSKFQHVLSPATYIRLKGAYNIFERKISAPGYTFGGNEYAHYSELSVNTKRKSSEWVAGLDLITDNFQNSSAVYPPINHTTIGLFVQNTWTATEKLTIESGLRMDRLHFNGEYEGLPRFSILYRWSPKVVTRVGGGFGYKAPTMFNEDSERLMFKNVLPIDDSRTNNEWSSGFNADINWVTRTGIIQWSVNQLFFYTRIADPLRLVDAGGGRVQFMNATGSIESKGMETNVKAVLGDFKLFVGYTFAHVTSYFDEWKRRYPLTPRHRLNNVLMYEIEEKLKLGLEAYYIGVQQLTDGTAGRSYWIMGFMAEKLWEKFSLFINFENFTNTRQTRWERINTGTIVDPVFKDIYAPVEGFVFNGGIKVKL